MNIIRLQGQNALAQGVYYEYDKDSTPIGEGGMGVLYLGALVYQMTGIKMPVVIKAMRDEINFQGHLIERARREASVQIDNENLIRMYDFVSNYENSPLNGAPIVRHYIVMEYLDGLNLDKVLEGEVNKNGAPVPLAQEIVALTRSNRVRLCSLLMRNLLSGVLALHNAGYIHRDLDPSNVMITRDGKVKIIDFGICKPVSGASAVQLTSAGSFMGKVQYASPELILGDIQNQNYSTDIYALGIILYQLYCGHRPYGPNVPDQTIMQEHLKGKLPYKDIDNKDLQRIFRKATAVQNKRYQTAAEFLVDLEKLQVPADSFVSRSSGDRIFPQALNGPVSSYPSSGYPSSGYPASGNPVSNRSGSDPFPDYPMPDNPPVSIPDAAPRGGTVPEGPLSRTVDPQPSAVRNEWTIPAWLYAAVAAGGGVAGVVLSLI